MKTIVITTIYTPSESLLKYVSMKDWNVVIVGDLKTPHQEYRALEAQNSNVLYLSPEDQDKKYPDLSAAIGWNKIQRRSVGFVEAYDMGTDVMATVDDDNIPYDNWGKEIHIGKTVDVDLWSCETSVFDPLSVTKHNGLWHRGYPIEDVPKKNRVQYLGKTKRLVKIQADLWDGDPDVDAICRITKAPIVKFDISSPYCSTKVSPFNSQNTFIARECIPHYFIYPYVGRMDDIWASYDLQKAFPDSLVYNTATVYQQRNEQDLIKNMSDELIGYRNTISYIDGNFELPDECKKAFSAYRKCFS
tara:strand:+ start:4555 stop:5463 length:909 start_codon:yes stop_codon:yes gene_type:complete